MSQEGIPVEVDVYVICSVNCTSTESIFSALGKI